MPRFYRRAAATELQHLTTLGGPLVVSNLAVVSMGVTDTIVAGRAGEVDLAGLALGSSIWAVCAVTLLGLLAAVSPIVAHLRGSRDEAGCARQFQQALWIAMIGGLIIVGALLAVPVWSQWIDTEEPVRHVMQQYLLALATGTLPFALGTAARGYCEGMGQVRPVMRIYLAAALLNIPLDMLFVFGAGPIPAMGGAGCGWATALVSWAIAGALFWHAGSDPVYRGLKLSTLPTRPHWPTQRHLLAVGLPICIGAASEVTFFASLTVLLASYGATIVAAHQISLNIGSIFYLVALALAQALSIRVAQLLGQGRPRRARFASVVGVGCGLVYALATGALLISLRYLFVLAYTSNEDIIAVAANLLLLCAAFQLVDVAQAMAWGALRGYRDTRVPMYVQLFSYWLVGLTAAYWLGENLWGVYGYWTGICVGLGTASILLGLRLWHSSGKLIRQNRARVDHSSAGTHSL
ncbi:MATE family efflux transporter [Microbulbifer thermotolerans]|uniref:Multidrug-efflux transporter n=1 Tax=Microbulbifer thermotolerans TaxID=252514 RepID=A0A143HJX7_MICTH|nr:MATE family efflux transporter [Microbulbifer thermotolerans]AMX02008.1 MATE family efflux transporter [Microbulbifer thermotolerans]MCX2794270.1 MATE family efflux transporter [Microbulbifer thermotolerans]MCX2800708.1 MATE family efflux transporter [Microbulbifer thermotolerans]MCX2834229.1 MATE family efflux transporter [Microbulbifer thermotolerans]